MLKKLLFLSFAITLNTACKTTDKEESSLESAKEPKGALTFLNQNLPLSCKYSSVVKGQNEYQISLKIAPPSEGKYSADSKGVKTSVEIVTGLQNKLVEHISCKYYGDNEFKENPLGNIQGLLQCLSAEKKVVGDGPYVEPYMYVFRKKSKTSDTESSQIIATYNSSGGKWILDCEGKTSKP